MKIFKGRFFQNLIMWVNGDTEHFLPPADTKMMESPKVPSVTQTLRPLPTKDEVFLGSFTGLSIFLVIGLVSILLLTTYNLPLFGDPDNPVVNEVIKRYVEKGVEETGAINVVAGMILDYRAFDTLGEASVLLLAGTSVMMLLLKDIKNTDPEDDQIAAYEMEIEERNRDLILQKITMILLPAIILYGIYVVINGHLSPGGGFSGGAILGAGLILYASAFGTNEVRKIFTMKTFKILTTSALMPYAICKTYVFLLGANGIDTRIPLGTPGAIFSSGLIFVLDVCVGIIVACTMYGFYSIFTTGEI